MKEFFSDLFDGDWSFREKILWTGCVASTCILIGFIIAPLKNGLAFSVLSHNKDCGSENGCGIKCNSNLANKKNGKHASKKELSKKEK